MKLKTFTLFGTLSGTLVATTAALVASADASAKKRIGTIISPYENVMDVMGISVGGDDVVTNSHIQPFSDYGSFHSYSLPTYDSRDIWGSFSAPMLITEAEKIKRLSKSMDKISFYEYKLVDGKPKLKENGEFDMKTINFKSLPTENVHIKQYPGGLWQEFEIDEENIVLQVDLRFIGAKVSSVKYKIINKSGSKRAFKINWSGKIYDQIAKEYKIEYEPISYLETKPLLTNELGQPLMKGLNQTTPKLIYVTKDKTSNKYIEYINAQEIDKSNSAAIFYDSTGKEVILYAPNAKLGDKSITVSDSFKAKKYVFVNKYDADDVLNVNNRKNIIKNSVSFKLNKTRTYSSTDGNWAGNQNDQKFQMVFPSNWEMEITGDDKSYSTDLKTPIFVDGNSNADFFVSTMYTFISGDRIGHKNRKDYQGNRKVINGAWSDLLKGVSTDKAKAAKAFDDTKKRWDYYLDNLLGGDDSIKTFNHRKVAVKGMETLVTNWIGEYGLLEKDGIVPSRSIYYFSTSYFSWDSWKQAVATVNFDPKLAMDNIKTMFDNQVVNDTSKQWMLYRKEPRRSDYDIGLISPLSSPLYDNINWRNTKPPLTGWGVWEVYNTIKNKMWNKKDIRTNKKLKDEAIDFLKYMYGRLLAFHVWWYMNRDADGNGINEYGASVFNNTSDWGTNRSEKDIGVSTAWESGMDNAPRFDTNGAGPDDEGLKFTLNRNADNSISGYVLQQESVDLNSYMYSEKQYLIKMAKALRENGVSYSEIEGMGQDGLNKVLIKPMQNQLKTRLKKSVIDLGIMQNIGNGYESDINQFEHDSKYLKSYINKKMFDNKTKFYYDLRYETNDKGERIPSRDHILSNRGRGPEGFIPLWANIATKSHAKDVRKRIMDPHGFNTYIPFPTTSLDNKKFEPDQYWRGPVWLDQAYYGVKALYNYGYDSNASYMVNKLFNNAEGLLEGGPIRETYNPLTGEGLDAKGFSWSSAMYLLMYERYIKEDK